MEMVIQFRVSVLVLIALMSYVPKVSSGEVVGEGFYQEGCNTGSYGATPSFGTRMIGRIMNGDPAVNGFPQRCPTEKDGERYSLTMVEMHWNPKSSPNIAKRYNPGGLTISAGPCEYFDNGLRFCMQTDKNLVLYDSNWKPLWFTQTAESEAKCTDCRAVFQSDGNLVLYDGSNPYWSSGTAGHENSILTVSDSEPFVTIVQDSIVLFSSNPSYVEYLYKVLDTSQPVSIENGTSWIHSAYDATLVPFDGEYWVAFECALMSDQVSSCVGPLKWDGHLQKVVMDLSRISIVVKGVVTGVGITHAASVPKLLSFPKSGAQPGQLYLYWDDILIDETGVQNDWGYTVKPDVQQYFKSITSRGALLEMNAQGKMYPHAGTFINANEGAVVMENADITQVFYYDGKVFATGSQTFGASDPSGVCAMPLNNWQNPDSECYRVFFAAAENPLDTFEPIDAYGRFNLPLLPDLPAAYNRFVYQPESDTMEFMGGSFIEIDRNQQTLFYRTTPMSFSVTEPELDPICDPLNNPFPQYVEFGDECLKTLYSPTNTVIDAGECRAVGNAKLCMQADKNLVIYNSQNVPLWASYFGLDPKANCTGCKAHIQNDGNIVLYDNNNTVYWSSDTSLGPNYTEATYELSRWGGLSILRKDGTPAYHLVNKQIKISENLTLTGGECVISIDPATGNKLRLCMQNTDGNLVLRNSKDVPLWASYTTACGSGCKAVFQKDGNVVILRNSGQIYWPTMTVLLPQDQPVTLMISTQFPHLSIEANNGPRFFFSNDLILPTALNAGQCIVAPGAIPNTEGLRLKLCMQTDRNLVLTQAEGRVLWAAGVKTSNCRTCRAIFQTDGNLVLYNGNTAYWNSGTAGNNNARLKISAQNSPYLSILNSNGKTVWPKP